jgi:predicted porin
MKYYVGAALLASFCASASAQPSINFFGVVDANVGQVRNGAAGRVSSVSSGGNETSRYGVRGSEDLGDGLSTSVWLEGQLFNDNGNLLGLNLQRRATISLTSKTLGEVRIGRDYTPIYWSLSLFDPFGVNGAGSQLNMLSRYQPIGTQNATTYAGALGNSAQATPLGSGASTVSRDSNSVGYFLPGGLGGVYGQAMAAASEGVAGGKFSGARLGYQAGPFNIVGAFGKTSALGTTLRNDLKTTNVAASYTFGDYKLMSIFNRETYDNPAFGSADQNNFMVGATAHIGQGTIKGSVTTARISGPAAYETIATTKNSTSYGLANGTAKMYALGYVYDLSKDTALYSTYSYIINGANTQFTVGGNGPAMGTLVGQNSSGYEIGIRRRF